MRHASLNRIGGNGLADYLKKSAIGAVIACIMRVMSLQGGASAKNIEDPMMLAGVIEYVAPGAGYENFSIANGDPNEEQGGDRPGGARIQPAPQPVVLPDIQGGDPQDQPVEQPDYSNFTIANGDPNEEQGGARPGGGRVQPALKPVPHLDIQAGDDGDKPVELHDYSGFDIGPGDPNEEAAPNYEAMPVADVQADYSNFTIANGDPNEEQGGARPGGGRVQPAPQPAVLPDLQAGDDGDKPVDEPDYSGFTIANGDPNEEGNQ